MKNKRKNKRVGMLVHSLYISDVRVRRAAETLSDNGFDVHVVCVRDQRQENLPKEASYEVKNGVHIHRLPLCKKRGTKFRYLFEYAMLIFFGAWKLSVLHFQKKFDVIHINNMPDILVLAGMIPKWTGATIILDIHDPMSELFQINYHVDDSHLMIRLLKFQERISYKLADHLITVSVPMAENVAKKSGRNIESIKVVHNFPDFGLFPVREDKEKWPYGGDGLVFLYSGTVTEHYRLDVAVRAFAKISKNIPNIKFLILGSGNRIKETIDLAKSLGIGDKVEQLKPVPPDMVKTIMAKADVGISTHQSGVFGELYFSNKILEFMTQGLPVITSRTYTLNKYIPDDSIFYFDPENIDDLVKQIEYMVNNPELVLDKTKNAKRLVGKYNWKNEKAGFVEFYENLCKNDFLCE